MNGALPRNDVAFASLSGGRQRSFVAGGTVPQVVFLDEMTTGAGTSPGVAWGRSTGSATMAQRW